MVDNKNYQQKFENKGEFENYDYLLILDFEATCDQGKKISPQEIIEFPVVPYDLKNNKIWTENLFHYYIKPTENPKLSEFCTQLTKITQETVDKGILLQEALERLDDYLTQTGIIKTNFIFVTCGAFDLKLLQSESQFKNIPIKNYMKYYINIKNQFPRNLMPSHAQQSGRFIGMAGMLKQLNLDLQGTHHSGIDDSKNIARIAYELINKHNMQFTSKMKVSAEYQQNPKKKFKKYKN